MEPGGMDGRRGAGTPASPDLLRRTIERIVRDVLEERAENATRVSCPALRARVWVRRDSRSVPHIEA